jgi:intracellular sulfur oxidation DsrE/DsrF family protein
MLMMYYSAFKNYHISNSEVNISICFNSLKRKTIINAKLSSAYPRQYIHQII